MKKLFFGLAASIMLCLAATSVNAQVQDTARRSNGNMGQQQGWPADSNRRDSVNNITPAPNNPTTSDTTHRNNGLTVPSDRTNTPNGNGNRNNGNGMTPGSMDGTSPSNNPNRPTTAPGTDTYPRPQTDVPDSPRPNMSPNSPTTPTTGAPM